MIYTILYAYIYFIAFCILAHVAWYSLALFASIFAAFHEFILEQYANIKSFINNKLEKLL